MQTDWKLKYFIKGESLLPNKLITTSQDIDDKLIQTKSKEIDFKLENWVPKYYYIWIFNNQIKECRRYYIVNQDTIVYHNNIKKQFKNVYDDKDVFLINNNHLECQNYFRVYTPLNFLNFLNRSKHLKIVFKKSGYDYPHSSFDLTANKHNEEYKSFTHLISFFHYIYTKPNLSENMKKLFKFFILNYPNVDIETKIKNTRSQKIKGWYFISYPINFFIEMCPKNYSIQYKENISQFIYGALLRSTIEEIDSNKIINWFKATYDKFLLNK